MKNILAANWKMNKGPKETLDFFNEFKSKIESSQQSQVLFFVPAIDLMAAKEALADTSYGWGAQNCFYENSGAFTGENSPEILKQIGTTHGLTGHSERRQIFAESDEWVAKKTKALLEQEITPIVCVGETLEQRESGKTEEVVLSQLQAALKGLKSDFIIAYEPVWAIGTGKVATPEMAEEVHAQIRQWLAKTFDGDKAANTAILYGGSVKPENAADLIKKENINGFLVGGASLQPDSFYELAKITLL